ncbi:MAG: DUF975 family protein [Clostridia bacterium]|nr:DUF975 family protein [Clostridia bacterium]
MKTRSELKALAKQQIKGNIGGLFLLSLIVALISGVCSIIPVVGSIASLVITPALSFSIILAYYKLSLGNGYKPDAGEAFGGFSNFTGAFRVYWAQSIFTFLWMLLLIIPGYIKGIAYSQAMYVLAENPEISGTEAIGKSQDMMRGHKMEYFVLQLSFIGWHLLAVLTFGLLYIWLIPYMSATNANFYQSIKPVEVYYTPDEPQFA